MRHANEDDLDRLEPLFAGLRALPALRERKRGAFSRGAKAFLHCHAEGEDLYVDVRFDSSFERVRVTSPGEQAELVSRIRRALDS